MINELYQDATPVPYATLHFLVVVGGGALFANPVEAALLGAPARPDAEDIRAHAEAVADVLIAGIAVTPPGPGSVGTAGETSALPEVPDGPMSSL